MIKYYSFAMATFLKVPEKAVKSLVLRSGKALCYTIFKAGALI